MSKDETFAESEETAENISENGHPEDEATEAEKSGE